MPRELPKQETSKNYIVSNSIKFKAKAGEYNGKINDEYQGVKEIKGVVVGTGFVVNKTLGTPSKKKAVWVTSNDFGGNKFKKGKIGISKLSRVNGEFSRNFLGQFAFEEIKSSYGPSYLFKTIFVLDSTDWETLHRIELAAGPTANAVVLPKGVTSYISTFSVTKEPEETEQGDFYRPIFTLTKEKVPEDKDELVDAKIEEIDAILQGDTSKDVDNTPEEKEETLSKEDSLEDTPF